MTRRTAFESLVRTVSHPNPRPPLPARPAPAPRDTVAAVANSSSPYVLVAGPRDGYDVTVCAGVSRLVELPIFKLLTVKGRVPRGLGGGKCVYSPSLSASRPRMRGGGGDGGGGRLIIYPWPSRCGVRACGCG